MVKKIDLIFVIFGIYFILLSIIAVINSFVHPDLASPLWFCYIAVFFIGIGILLKKSEIIITQINITAMTVIIWNVDFFYQLITKKPLFGITDYFFVKGWSTSVGNFITLQHLYILPVSFIFIYIIGDYKKDLWKWSFLEVLLVFFAGLILTSPDKNVNCMFTSCLNFISLNSPYYQILWFFSLFLMIFLTNFVIVRILKKHKKRNE